MDELQIERPQAMGHLELLWSNVWEQPGPDETGELTGWTVKDVARAAEWDGDAAAFVGALHTAGFLDLDGSTYSIHDYIVWMPSWVKDRLRKRRWREAKDAKKGPFTRLSRDKSRDKLGRVRSDIDVDEKEEIDLDVDQDLEKKGGAGGKRKADLFALDGLPAEFQTPAFRDAWADWVGHRREIRHPLSPRMVKAQFQAFAEWGVARATAAIIHTIRMGWQGLREEQETKGGNVNRESADDRRAKQRAIEFPEPQRPLPRL